MAEKTGTKICKHCKSEIPAGAKVCPNCRKKQGSIIKWIVLALVALLIIGAVAGGGGSDEPDPKDISYTKVTVDKLGKALDKNALNAEEKYKGEYLAITGKLGNIDSDGSYIGLDADDWSIWVNVQCFIQDDDQLKKVKKMSKGDRITVKGKCTEVGELLGYMIDIVEIK